MKIGTSPSFLVLERSHSDEISVRVVESHSEALRDWRASTRLSPIFGVSEHGTAEPQSLEKTRHLIFLGPVHPELVGERLRQSRLWLTLGLFNVLVATNLIRERRALLDWAQKHSVPFEAWNLSRGRVVDVQLFAHQGEVEDVKWRADLSELSERISQEELQDAVKEYCPLMASTLARSEHVTPAFIDNLKQVHESVLQIFSKAPEIAPDDATYVTLGQILTINASLSRFASQTFAGSSPISETECHFWSHSLLGIGIPTIALWKLRQFLQRTLGEARIPAKIAQLETKENSLDLLRLRATDPFWSDDHLGKLPPTAKAEDKPLVPLITYFSARDGFKSVLATISVPLATVAKCNSVKWSLNTLTHEISHVILRSVLSDLYPNLRSQAELEKALSLYLQLHPAPSLLDEIRRLLLVTIVKLESPHIAGPPIRNYEKLRSILESWQREVEEILVHVFDFLYFYGGDPERYLSGIWLSWGTIPHIKRRVREYVIRSVCAVLAKHLKRGGEAENQAREQTLEILQSLPGSDEPGSYVNFAIMLLTDNWNDIRNEVLARKGLVKIATTFLYSPTIAYKVREETDLVGGTEKDREGYALRPNNIEIQRILNPLHFLELFTKSKRPSEVESAWIFYVLAFCVRDDATA